jgi:modulator of FtsH protease
VNAEWGNFYVAAAGAAAALTGLLFVAVALRPTEIRDSSLMAGRARSAFYAFGGVLLVTLLELAPQWTRWVGVVQCGIAATVIVMSAPFTMRAMRAGQLNYRRSLVYHGGLVVVMAAGVLRALALGQVNDVVLASGVMLLLGIALSNAWQLVISHQPARHGD